MKDQDELKQALEGLGPGYRFVRELGRGTTAIVYLVEDAELGRELAVKVIRSSFIHDDEAMARLQREARLVAQMQHPNIVKLFGTRHLPDGSMALLMEHVPGRNLREVLLDVGALKQRRALGILKEVASALAYAHRRRIVHRDVKPENIYIDEEVGTARLADFGVARPWDRDARLTLPGESLGTPAYMSPEQIDAQEVDGRSDVYSLGLVGYEMLAGKHPWESDNLYSIIFKQKHEELPSLEALRPGVPAELAEALEQALHKEPDKRWSSADEMLDRLERIELTEPRDPFFELLEPDVETGVGEGREPASIEWGAVAEEITPVEDWPVQSSATVPKPKRRRGLALLALPIIVAGGVFGWLTLRPGGPPWATTGLEFAIESPTDSDGNTDPVPDPPAASPIPTLSAVAGTGQEGQVGIALASPLVVKVSGPDGSALADTTVVFRIVQGGGTLDPEVARTDSTGTASVALQLPDVVSPIVVLASLQGLDSVAARFDVQALPGPPVEIEPVGGDGQAATVGQMLGAPLAVRVIDDFGNAVSGVTVAFDISEGDGRITPTAARTDAVGIATARWRLGTVEGPQVATATAVDAGGATQRFSANALAAPTPRDPEPPVEEEPPPPAEPLTRLARSFSIGATHICLLDGRGRVDCRGDNDRGQSAGGRGNTFIHLASGVRHTCGFDSQGIASCWGANEAGQLGDGTTTDRNSANLVEGDVTFSVLSAGLSHTCGLDSVGTAYCWGANVSGQVGDGTRASRLVPSRVDVGVRFNRLAVGWRHSCALQPGGQAWCWGLNSQGQLGDGSLRDAPSPALVATPARFSLLTAGSTHTCALGDGRVYCWGDNGNGQLGTGSTTSSPTPMRIELPENATSVVAGAVHTCALLASGSAYCWGGNTFGQLGDGTTTNRLVPTQVSGDYRFETLEAGGSVTCGRRGDDSEWCWGLNQNGQLGDGTRTNRSVPWLVGG